MANKLRDEDLQLNIIVNGDKGKKELGDLEKSTRDLTNRNKELRAEKDKLIRAGKQETEEFKKVTAEIAANNKAIKTNEARMTELRKEIGLTGLTMRQLRSEQTRLKRLMDSATPGTPQWQQYRAELIKVEAQMGKVAAGAKASQFSMGKMADGFNRYFSMISVWVASATGVIFGFKKASDVFAQFDDKVADVQKTTKMTKDEVLELNKEFENIDTRTTWENLNTIAEEGGRIGIAKEELLGFTEAMDKANVALSDSFTGGTEEIAKTLGRLKFLFEDTKEMDVEKAYLAIGSAINELGADGVANEQNIANFATRVGSLSAALKPAAADALALGAAFEESGIEAEIASRAYSIVLNRATVETDKFAAVMGLSVKEVEDMINANPVDFFLKFSESLKGMNATDTSRTLDNLKINAEGANKVIGAAANNTDRFRQLLELSNKEFQKGTSIIDEFNIKNNTRQAQIEKSRKNLELVTRELGENLSPAVLISTNGFTYFVKAMTAVVKVTKEHYPIILTSAAAIAGYTIAVNAQNIATKAYSALTTVATAVTKGFNTAVKSNPIGLIVGLLAAGATALALYSRRLSETERVQKSLNEVDETARKNIIAEKVELEQLLRVANDERKSKADRLAAIKKLNEISPDYLGSLTLEKLNTDEARKAVDNYSESLLKNARIAAARAKLEEVEGKLLDLELGKGADPTFWQQTWNVIKSGGNAAAKGVFDATTAAKNLAAETAALTTEKEKLQAIIDKGGKTGTETKGGNKETVDDSGVVTGSIAGTEKTQAEKLNEFLTLSSEKQQDAFREYFSKAGKNWFEEFMAAIENESANIDFSILPEKPEEEVNNPAADYALQKYQETIEFKLALNQSMYEKGLIGEQQYQDQLTELTRIAEDQRYQIKAENIEKAKALTDVATNFVTSLMDFELEKAGDNEEKKKEIKKKYADLNFAVTVAQIIASTAGAIMKGFEELGPIGGAIAAVLLGATGLVQIGVANAQRKKVKGYAKGGYAYEDQYRVAEEGPEFIASNPAVRNPEVKQFLDIFDYYQRTGQISKLNTKMILASLPVQQMATGGYSSSPGTSSTSQNPGSGIQYQGIDRETANRLIDAIDKFTKKELKVYSEMIKKDIDALNEIEQKR